MSVPVAPNPHRIRTPRPVPLAVPLASVAVAAAAGGAAVAAAPDPARAWVAVTLAVAWAWVAVTVAVAALGSRRLRTAAIAADGELRALQTQSAQSGAEAAHLVNVTLPSVVKRLRDGESSDNVLASTSPPADGQLRLVLQRFTTELAACEQHARTASAAGASAVQRLARSADDLDRLTARTLPAAIERLRSGASADTALAALEQPDDARLRVILDSIVREFALSERRASAAMGASAKTLSRVQAKAVTMLADLRDMQDRYGEDVFGDLLKLDHNTSQLGLLTDRLALLMGGRASRTWNKPIGMESILRGAVGRIASYRRVRLHSSSTVSVAGYAAEGVMHLLAELIDNAANFSPPIDEVHVYVEERTAGLVVTVEDSGLKMTGPALRRAEEAVSAKVTDLARLRSTRIGLVVVGMLAAKYNMTVNFRPSSRGGTGVVVLFPPQLLHQSRGIRAEPSGRPANGTGTATGAAAGTGTTARPEDASPGHGPAPGAYSADSAPATTPTAPPAPVFPPGNTPRVATPNGLPVRPRGRTMAAADRGRTDAEGTGARGLPRQRDAGTQFGAFHRSRKPRNDHPVHGEQRDHDGTPDGPPQE
ncbi:ATP-binding protein [Streptomyces sp. NPDC004609]|uniref:sensor histidine kinase n=1 Tax=Streptomyces sp. NPDC004609 TaxID=3364704 RepID=UPI0036916B35